jgi:hypothetical protein
MSVARRRDVPKPCAYCGGEFFPWRTTQRFCSMSCAASRPRPNRRVDSNLPTYGKNGRAGNVRECVICGGMFTIRPAELARRKTCSRACAAELKRSRGGERRKGAGNPNFKSGRRVGVRDREGERRWREALGSVCAAPGCTTPYGAIQPLFLHHLVYRQHVRREGGDIWDPRNALTICNRCHASHHQRGRVLPVAMVPEAARAFAVELFGEARAADYFARRYAPEEAP